MKPRDYQQAAIDGFFSAAKKYPNDDLVEVLPTGAGKTIIMSHVAGKCLQADYPVIVTARTRELLVQNHGAFLKCFPEMADDAGIYCAGLGLKQFDKRIVFASVQSAVSKAELFGKRKLAILDECHQVPLEEESQYQKLLTRLRGVEPSMKLLGLTASPYRLDGGLVFGPGQQFDRVAYTVPLGLLIDEGYITKPQTLKVRDIDLTGCKITAGDFNRADVESRFLIDSITDEMLASINKTDSKSVLVFTSGVAHAEVIKGELERKGEKAHVITGETLPLIRETSIQMFKDRKIRWLINCEVLTTGFDAPNIDAIVIARATQSPGLFLQMVGRGFRLFPGKELCWVLDYGGNIERHGTIDSPDFGINTIIPPREEPGKPPTRVCPTCFTINLAASSYCVGCGREFPKKPKEFYATDKDIVGKPERFEVMSVRYSRHLGKEGKKDTLRADYRLRDDNADMGTRRCSEWICIEHEGYARSKAAEWWQECSDSMMPDTIEDALDHIQNIGIAECKEITVQREGKYSRVNARVYGEKPEPAPLDWGLSEEEIPF